MGTNYLSDSPLLLELFLYNGTGHGASAFSAISGVFASGPGPFWRSQNIWLAPNLVASSPPSSILAPSSTARSY